MSNNDVIVSITVCLMSVDKKNPNGFFLIEIFAFRWLTEEDPIKDTIFLEDNDTLLDYIHLDNNY
mgnify:CR=1 FL=1